MIKKKYPINPKYIKKEVEVRIREILGKVIIGEEIGHLVENVAMVVIEDMEEVEVILGEVPFEVELILILGKMRV